MAIPIRYEKPSTFIPKVTQWYLETAIRTGRVYLDSLMTKVLPTEIALALKDAGCVLTLSVSHPKCIANANVNFVVVMSVFPMSTLTCVYRPIEDCHRSLGMHHFDS